MRFSNISGNALMVMPYSVPKYSQTLNTRITGATALEHHSFTTDNNDFYFFKSAKPSSEVLFAIETKDSLLADHGADLICRLENQKIVWSYNTETRQRFIKKDVDALDMNVEQDGDIVWCAIVCTQEETFDENGNLTSEPVDNTKDSIIFTDKIGDWSNTNLVITLDRLNGLLQNEIVAFKDFSFILRDKADQESI